MNEWIAAQFQRAIDQTAGGHGDWCMTLEAVGDEDRWVQITADALNLAYPSPDDPAELLSSLPDVPGLEMQSWEPDLFLTLSYDADVSLPAAVDLVAAYIEHVLGKCVHPDDWNVTEQTI